MKKSATSRVDITSEKFLGPAMRHFIEIDGEIVPVEFCGKDAAKTRDDLMGRQCYAKSIIRILRVPDFATIKRSPESKHWQLVGCTEN